MSIQIIQLGKIPEEVRKQVSCWNCESVLEYTKKDLYFGQITCPVCKESIEPQST